MRLQLVANNAFIFKRPYEIFRMDIFNAVKNARQILANPHLMKQNLPAYDVHCLTHWDRYDLNSCIPTMSRLMGFAAMTKFGPNLLPTGNAKSNITDTGSDIYITKDDAKTPETVLQKIVELTVKNSHGRYVLFKQHDPHSVKNDLVTTIDQDIRDFWDKTAPIKTKTARRLRSV